MTGITLSKIGTSLVRRYGTRDPFQIAERLGINVLYCDGFGSLKGMYRVIKRNRYIFLNKDLGERMQRIVCAHELGHDQLHRKLRKHYRTLGSDYSAAIMLNASFKNSIPF